MVVPQDKILQVSLIGNPNSGKSTIFNHLTGLRQKTGNFPGVTVEKKTGYSKLASGQKIEITDFPGLYSLFTNSKEEFITAQTLIDLNSPFFPDVVICVANITKLEKHLLLFHQLKDLGLPILLVLNMYDLVEDRKLDIDLKFLEKELKIKILPVSGKTGFNIDKIGEALEEVIDQHKFISAFDSKNVLKGKDFRSVWLRANSEKITWWSDSEKQEIQAHLKSKSYKSLNEQVEDTMDRFNDFAPIVKKAVSSGGDKRDSFTWKLDKIVTHKVLGPLVFFLTIFFVFQAIFTWSSIPMDAIDNIFGLLTMWVESILPDNMFRSLIIDGVLAGLNGVLIFIPQIAILFFLVQLLEDVGYMSRGVFLFDNLMQKFGLNGRSIVALISGGACAIPAIMSTRIIANWKERLITILVTPFISCSARIPVFAILIAIAVPSKIVFGFFNQQGLVFFGLYILGILAALTSALILKYIIKSESKSFLLLELPEYKVPNLKSLLINVFDRVKIFVLEAGKIIFIISILLWFLASFGPSQKMHLAEDNAISYAIEHNLDGTDKEDLIASNKLEASYIGHLGKFIEPAVRPLGFDWKIGIALITSFAAREVFVGSMATIYAVGSSDDETKIQDRMAAEINPDTGVPVFNFATSMSLLIFYLFAMQCMSTLAIVKRETNSWFWPISQFVVYTIIAYVSSFAVYNLLV